MDKTYKRADRTKVVEILNRKDSLGIPIMPGGESRLRKDLERFTISCPDCGEDGRYDEEGDIVCDGDNCSVVISDKGENIYADKYCSGSANDAAHGNRGASGHPNLRKPALRSPGPSGDDSIAN
jgi:hypothetical protein